jgi:hypothetical protein
MTTTTFQGAKIHEQGINFAIVIVEPHVVSNPNEANRIAAVFQLRVFPGIPVVLMAQDPRGVPAYYGRHDIVKFLAGVPVTNIPWQQFTFTE